MNQNNLTPCDFDRLHEASQKIFEALARKAQQRYPALKALFGRTTTQKFPMFSHVTFEDKSQPNIDPVVVGIDVRVDMGLILLEAEIVGEETGKVHFELPNQELPFGSDYAVVLDQTTRTVQQLADNATAVLEQVFGYAKPLRAPA
jgi:hypothetical protein